MRNKIPIHSKMLYPPWISTRKCEYQVIDLAFTQLPLGPWWKTSCKHKKAYINVESWNWSCCETMFFFKKTKSKFTHWKWFMSSMCEYIVVNILLWNTNHAPAEWLEWKVPTKLSSMASCCKNFLQEQHNKS